MIAAAPSGLGQTRALARLHNPTSLQSFVYEDSGRRLVALLNTGSCDDGACAPRRIVVRSADQIELAGLSDHDRAEVAAVLTEHANRQERATA